ncbi:glucosamine-6-phosphate deaminase [Anseongella ginsenosidimutans]|uniref:Glucosamine-6-phosphate deaminase n=1 Tax=Anseongella ginsenosidimutans TaxID=496056 RepID=A0A4R3KU13_9SPHI|nr:glucosamine-6-phosphate deaminase [Anseongella ginsenosidimutans]QEC51530.1 glucosamine-6-phosphate deaminase [Anseongella ginsenosidimutans]TCS88849.1 glucosamine-6-phosphate deaminase [Anseongella ginsenosidimutans]
MQKQLTDFDLERIKAFEQIHTEIFENSSKASLAVASEMASLIRKKEAEGKPCVLGLATGNTPKLVYIELVRLHREEGLSFRNVYSFNLDEYYPIAPDSPQSYVRFMKEMLFDHVDIPEDHYFIPDGRLPMDRIPAFCKEYEQKIEELGGLDIQLLGIGSNGHIGFNEPGSLVDSKTRLIALNHTTRAGAASDFGGLSATPKKGITLGVKAIMSARRVILMAWGESKADVIKLAVEGPVTERIPASYLQAHPNTTFVIDEASAQQLTKYKSPWLVETVTWDNKMIRKAVTQLALQLGKSVLKLTDKDYNDNGLSDLLAVYGHAYDINIQVFNQLQHTITGWPGGKPNADDTYRPERAEPASKRVIIFSPHPDDDIISMGGTFIRLHEQGHEVHVAYQTSGNIAVSDDEALRYIDFAADLSKRTEQGIDHSVYDTARDFLKKKKPGEIDIPEVRTVKAIIRRSEAKATCRFVGLPDEQVHFLDLPFYETGLVQKKPLGDEDVQIVARLIDQVKPQQIYAAGDLADPHGTHKVCLDAVFAAIEQLKDKEYMKDCWLWLYRGAWAEWDIHEIEMAVPMSPEQVLQKRYGIFKHQSQKDGVVFQGNDSREFWQRAEDRNAATAALYNKLGLAEYAAMEAFVRWKF